MTQSVSGIFLAQPEIVQQGIPLAVKDLFDTAGLPTTCGSLVFANRVPSTTAEAVRRLQAAGYAIVGKANLDEFAYGTTSENAHFGAVPNPAAPGRVAGGSSGGSAAALAAGLADAALGSDTGGSIRIPAACCGVVGFKPTFGLVSLEGCFPLSPSFDHAGPMARSVKGCSQMMKVLTPELQAADLKSLEEISIGVAWTSLADSLVRARVQEAISRFPHHRALPLQSPDKIIWAVFMREVADTHRELFAEHADLYSPNLTEKIRRCLQLDDADYERGLRSLADYREHALDLLSQVDLVVTPTLPCVAPPLGRGELSQRERLIACTRPFNAVGAPALAVPCGMAEHGFPASIQLAGRPGQDALVLAAGELLENALSRAYLDT
jgi:aspartyl-tRNA(Asn)/glutamyl-tRNA(Gln) amidotransferase subunit A